MSYEILISQEFNEEYMEIVRTYASLKKKVIGLRDHLKEFWISFQIFQHYDCKPLTSWYFRVKFPPYRIIIKVEKDCIKLEKIFKRKGKDDYKRFS